MSWGPKSRGINKVCLPCCMVWYGALVWDLGRHGILSSFFPKFVCLLFFGRLFAFWVVRNGVLGLLGTGDDVVCLFSSIGF